MRSNDVELVELDALTHENSGVELPAAGEDRQHLEHGPLDTGQGRRARPVDGGVQRSMSFDALAATAEQPEHVVEVGFDVDRVHDPGPCRSQFDGQRHPIEPMTDSGHCRHLGSVPHRRRVHLAGPTNEQLDRRRIRLTEFERTQRVRLFTS